MKYSAKKRWAIDLQIICDRSGLCCQDVIDYTRKIYKAISANGNACGVSPYIGDEFYHEVNVWGDNNGDNNTLITLCAEMAAAGCVVVDDRG